MQLIKTCFLFMNFKIITYSCFYLEKSKLNFSGDYTKIKF